MIVCPNCSHQNPDGAMQCEACYTPLPAAINCPNCGAMVQSDASFCGQCGFNLRAVAPAVAKAEAASKLNQPFVENVEVPTNLPELISPDSLIAPEPIFVSATPNAPSASAAIAAAAEPPDFSMAPGYAEPDPLLVAEPVSTVSSSVDNRTQLQQQTARLLHVQTNAAVELPNIPVVHIGKPNDRIPPDVDVSGFPNSEIVSRIHADIRLEADVYYIEDVGSSNGTYINNLPLVLGNRHRLRPGDRIGLGKGDKVTFLFQLS